MMLSPQFLARMCWVTNSSFTNIPYHKSILSGCTDVSDIIDNLSIDIEDAECVLYTFTLINTKKCTLVVFKSSDSRDDWDDNYDIRLRDYSGDIPVCMGNIFSYRPLLHNGYVTQYNLIQDTLTAYLSKHSDADYHIITGFSLGGGMATIVSYILNLKNTIHIVFGNPRVGNRAFVTDFCNKSNIIRSERWVFNKDPIPRLPIGIIYKHTPGVKRITDKSDEIIEVDTCSLFELINYDYTDHDLMRYFDKIDTTSIFGLLTE